MHFTEDDATELTKEIMTLFNGCFVVNESGVVTHHFDDLILEREEARKKILQLIRKKLKLTRSYKIISAIKSPVHGNIEIEQENFVEAPRDLHYGIRLIFGEIQSETEEEYNIKLLTAKEIRFFLKNFKSILKSCKHTDEKTWKKVYMGIGEDGERWYHYICPCNILQDVEIRR